VCRLAELNKLDKVAINDALPLKAARREAIATVTFRGFESELQTNPMLLHLDSPSSVT